MSFAVSSRFACLKLEDEEPVAQKKNPEKKRPEKGQEKKNNNKKNVNNQKQGNDPKKDKKSKQHMQKQWEEWKEKDDKFVNGNFEQDLENAILLSKLHYEENKDKYNSKASDNNNKKTNNKKNKKKVMSLNEFLSPKEKVEEEVPAKTIDSKENFFDEVHTDAKKELTKDQLTEMRKQRKADIEEIISSAQYQEKLNIERKKNKALEKELTEAKEEIANVKSRNQTLYTMLSTGEMKDKADVLLELERLNIIKNDLTDEVARLHGLLEQERSKVAALMGDNKHKDKKTKKHA